MEHLKNNCQIQISGDYQKQQLISYGYYHGYKGYRFIKNKQNKISYTDFNEAVAVIEYDNNLKAALYSHLMFIETAIKNIVCNEAVTGLKLGTFEYIYKVRMHDDTQNTKLLSKRLKLRNAVYSKLPTRHHDEEDKENQMVVIFIIEVKTFLYGLFLKYYI